MVKKYVYGSGRGTGRGYTILYLFYFFRLMDIENRLTDNCQREGGLGAGEKSEGIKKRNRRKTHGHDSMLIAGGRE